MAFEPAQREALRPADVWALLIDATGPLAVQERACSKRVRFSRREELRMVLPDPFSLDFEHRQLVDATRATPTLTVEAGRMHHVQPTSLLVQLGVQGDDRVRARHLDAP